MGARENNVWVDVEIDVDTDDGVVHLVALCDVNEEPADSYYAGHLWIDLENLSVNRRQATPDEYQLYGDCIVWEAAQQYNDWEPSEG